MERTVATRPIAVTISLSIIAAGAMAGSASAQTTIYQVGPGSAFISKPVRPPVAAMMTPSAGPGVTYYTVPVQPQQQTFQPQTVQPANPAQQNWRQFTPSPR
jgi:hypothetical protein